MKNLFISLFLILTLNGFAQFNWSTEVSYMPVIFEKVTYRSAWRYSIFESEGFGIRLIQNYIFRQDSSNFGLITGANFTSYTLNNTVYEQPHVHDGGKPGKESTSGTMMTSIKSLSVNLGLEWFNIVKKPYLQVYTSPFSYIHEESNYDLIHSWYYQSPDTLYEGSEPIVFTNELNLISFFLYQPIIIKTGLRFNIKNVIKTDIGFAFSKTIYKKDNYFLKDNFRLSIGLIF